MLKIPLSNFIFSIVSIIILLLVKMFLEKVPGVLLEHLI